MRKMAEDAAKRFFGRLWDDFLGYFRVYDYIKLKKASLTGHSVSVPTVESFWYSVLGDRFAGDRESKHLRLRDGDVVKFKDVFLTDWAPKLPGQTWTLDGVEDFAEAQEHFDDILEVNQLLYAVLPPASKKRVVEAGYGSIRIARRSRDTDHFMYMSLVSKDHWHCDLGIPVVVSRQVYEQFYTHAEHGAPWLREVEGVLHLHEDLPFEMLVPRAIGAQLSPESEATLRYRGGLPRCHVHIVSPLSVDPTFNDSHPSATAWTQFETTRRREPYRYTYTMFNPSSPDSTEAAVAFIKRYVHKYDGRQIIADFDAQRPKLDALLPLTTSPLRSRKFRPEIERLIANYNDWIRQEMKRVADYR